jgi:hypothetical protein
MNNTGSTAIDWNQQLLDQLDWYWQRHMRPRLNGLTDEEEITLLRDLYWHPTVTTSPAAPPGHR